MNQSGRFRHGVFLGDVRFKTLRGVLPRGEGRGEGNVTLPKVFNFALKGDDSRAVHDHSGLPQYESNSD